jgi:hypothetical protein
MSKQEIRDSHNKLVGYIEDQGNGKLKAYDTMNRHKGTYEKSSDRTYTPNNSLVGSGNQLVKLIFE